MNFAAWSGLRAGEVGGLRVGRVNVLRNEVTVAETVVRLRGCLVQGEPKSRRSHRTVPIPATLMAALADHIAAGGLGPADYVFPDELGGPLRHERFYRQHYRPAVAAVGRPDATFHALRHTYATLMAPHIAMLELSRRMGHQSYAMTADIYSHLYETPDAAKAAALDAAYTAPSTTNVVALAR